PHLAIVATTLLSAILAFFFDYRQLVGMSNVTVVVQYLFTCLAVLALRRRPTPVESTPWVTPAGPVYRSAGTEERARPWVIPGGPIVPIAGAIGSLVLVFGASLAELFFAAAALVVGVVVGLLSSRGRSAEEITHAPPDSPSP
ncbi:MAG: hypothetical protein ABI193_11585, partial [Minicystis sp.]